MTHPLPLLRDTSGANRPAARVGKATDAYLGKQKTRKSHPDLWSRSSPCEVITAGRGGFPSDGHRDASLYRKDRLSGNRLTNRFLFAQIRILPCPPNQAPEIMNASGTP
jgi:hypothetical protein